MGQLRGIPRTAAFAWSTSVTKPLIATGTRAGAVDADFSDETKLEVWAVGNAKEQKPIASVNNDSRFYDLAWSEPTKEHTGGVIAGALENGSLDLFDAAKLINGETGALIARTSKHSGPIKALQFNPHRPELLATAGVKGELYITDLNNPENPFRVGTAAARADDFDALDWNKKVAHILVTGSTGGFVTVWDIKAKKESLTLNNYGRKPVSAVAWNPDVPTKLATAVPTDQDAVILLWNLRNSGTPERVMKGHDQGILSLSWCPQDSSLLLSCGKDNRSICWNPHTGDMLGEFPIVLNHAFQTRWSPRHPGFLATASFDGKVMVQSIQNTGKTSGDSAGTTAQAADASDFFASAQTQPQASSFNLHVAPQWMKRPVGVSFGYGGKVVTFGPSEEQPLKSSLKIGTFVSDSKVETSISEFRDALKQPDVTQMCQSRIETGQNDASKEDWKVIQTLTSESPRKRILAYLGFEGEIIEDLKSPTGGEEDWHGETDRTPKELAPPSTFVKGHKANRLSQFFDNTGDNANFLKDLAASKGARTNRPFHIFSGKESEVDKKITRALMLGSFDQALDICLKENRMSDAFMVAICGGQTCIDKAQAAYFSQQSDGPNFARLLASVVGKDLWDVVYNADLENWKEVMATLCTFADENDFQDLCEALGDRLEEAQETRKNASFCYLAGSKLDKVIPIWIDEMNEAETKQVKEAEDESAFCIHVQSLQSFIEKVSIFRRATQYEDRAEHSSDSEWKLDSLYSKYAEYADVVAAHGHLDLAEEYINVLPNDYPAAEVSKNRVAQALKRPSAKATQRNQIAAGKVTPVPAMQSGRPAPNAAYAPSYPTQQATNAYAPSQSANSYAPSGPYGPTDAYQPSGPQLAPPPSGLPGGAPPPPRAQPNGTNWNDLPDGLTRKPPRSGRATPNPISTAAAYGVPQANAYQNTPPPFGQKSTPTLPPPPKGGPGQPPRGTPPPVDRTAHNLSPPRPTSSSTSNYAPQQPPQTTYNQPGPMQRTASPYNPPPSAAPPSSRYAPAPASQASQPSAPPPMGGRAAVAPNPYASNSQYVPQQSQYAPPAPQSQYAPSGQQMQNQGPQPSSTGPPPSGRPASSIAPPPRGSSTGPTLMVRPGSATSQKSASGAATAPRHPPGDRTHIPATSASVHTILSTEMARIKSRAPANFKPQVDDTEKRLNLLFDALNNDTVPTSIVGKLRELSDCVKAREFEKAQMLHADVSQMVSVEGAGVGSGAWMVGVKRLVSMSRATPV